VNIEIQNPEFAAFRRTQLLVIACDFIPGEALADELRSGQLESVEERLAMKVMSKTAHGRQWSSAGFMDQLIPLVAPLSINDRSPRARFTLQLRFWP
jgi:hypothetical protein